MMWSWMMARGCQTLWLLMIERLGSSSAVIPFFSFFAIFRSLSAGGSHTRCDFGDVTAHCSLVGGCVEDGRERLVLAWSIRLGERLFDLFACN